MFVFGIDPGLTTTGYGMIEVVGGSARAVAFGVIRTAPDRPIGMRLAELHADLSAVLAECRPDVAAIEYMFVNQNRQTATSVGRASGVAILAAAQAGLAVHEYTPTTVKKTVAGWGAAPKLQVQKAVMQRLGLDELPKPADAADALAVALAHASRSRLAAAAAK